LYTYDQSGKQSLVPPDQWGTRLPPAIYKEVAGLEKLVFSTPKYELPSYWRQVNPDIYKEEIAGYLEKEPGYVHEMSSDMSKAYFEAAVETGDPLFVDGTGANYRKMAMKLKSGINFLEHILFKELIETQVKLSLKITSMSKKTVDQPFRELMYWNFLSYITG